MENRKTHKSHDREDNTPRDKEDIKQKKEEKIDEQLEQSFPASDPPSYSSPGNDLDEEE